MNKVNVDIIRWVKNIKLSHVDNSMLDRDVHKTMKWILTRKELVNEWHILRTIKICRRLYKP